MEVDEGGMRCCQGLVRVRTLLAEFCTYWSLSRAFLVTPLTGFHGSSLHKCDNGIKGLTTESESDDGRLEFLRWQKA